MLILSFELQYPFRGDNGISPAVWTACSPYPGHGRTRQPVDAHVVMMLVLVRAPSRFAAARRDGGPRSMWAGRRPSTGLRVTRSNAEVLDAGRHGLSRPNLEVTVIAGS